MFVLKRDCTQNFHTIGSNITKQALDREVLKFTLSLYNNPLLSRKAVDDVLQMFNKFTSQQFVPFIQKQQETKLKPITDEKSYCKAQFILEKNKNIFQKFSTKHLRFKIYEQESLYVPPQIIEIGEESVFVITNYETITVEMKSRYAAYISFVDTLQMVLAIPGVLNEMQIYVNNLYKEETHLSNFVQGDLWKKKYKDAKKIVFPIFLYFDEFETGNPLGSHAGEEKFGGVYISLPSLPPHLVAKLGNIFISTIFHWKYLKIFGNQKLFRKTIEDLNFLSTEGINVHINGQDQRICFECVLILGDNLGLNCICGFSESFVAKSFCRIFLPHIVSAKR